MYNLLLAHHRVSLLLVVLLAAGNGCTVLLPILATRFGNRWNVKPPAELSGVKQGRTIWIGLRRGGTVEGEFSGYCATDDADGLARAAAPDRSTAIAILTESGPRVIPISEVSWVRYLGLPRAKSVSCK